MKALFVLEMFTFLSGHFGCRDKQLGKKAMVNFKFHRVGNIYYNTICINAPIYQEVKATRQ